MFGFEVVALWHWFSMTRSATHAAVEEWFWTWWSTFCELASSILSNWTKWWWWRSKCACLAYTILWPWGSCANYTISSSLILIKCDINTRDASSVRKSPTERTLVRCYHQQHFSPRVKGTGQEAVERFEGVKSFSLISTADIVTHGHHIINNHNHKPILIIVFLVPAFVPTDSV